MGKGKYGCPIRSISCHQLNMLAVCLSYAFYWKIRHQPQECYFLKSSSVGAGIHSRQRQSPARPGASSVGTMLWYPPHLTYRTITQIHHKITSQSFWVKWVFIFREQWEL